MLVSLQFRLDVEDGWPPVGSESLPFETLSEGVEALVAPMFVKDLSAHDILEVEKDEEGYITTWTHKKRSDHSTVWVLRLAEGSGIVECLEKARAAGCNTASLDQFGCYSIDVPGSLAIATVDEILGSLSEDEAAIAYPSMRHPD